MEYLLFTDSDILERVDEYTLYCFYLGYEPFIGAKTESPIRAALGKPDDGDPSFGIFERKSRGYFEGNWPNEFLWKDSGLGVHGDIFTLVMHLYGFNTRREAYLQVMADFSIGGTSEATQRVMRVEKKYVEPREIVIQPRDFTPKDMSFWKQFNITRDHLKMYDVHSLRAYWLVKSQQFPSFPKGSVGFAYSIFDRYQLYFPYAPKKAKFKSSFNELCIPGFKQLQFNSDLCIITKSMKDVIMLRTFGYEAVSPRSENTLLPQEMFPWLDRKYKRKLVLFDNDMKHKGDSYPYPKIYVPKNTEKDPTDFCKRYGIQSTAEMLRQIIGQ